MVERRPDVDGRFNHIRRLGSSGGQGNFSLLFSACDATTGARVALKCYNPDGFQDTYRLACFEREARILETLAGQRDIIGWVAPYSQFEEQLAVPGGPSYTIRFPYYAAELAHRDVAEIIAGGAWDAKQNLLAFRAMCRAVQRTHARGIVHRDLKPGNFLVMRNGDVKLADFGAARQLGGAGSPPLLPSYAQFWPGDTRYTAPEMIAGLHDHDPDIAFGADLFSLGAILFQLFSGVVLVTLIYDPQLVNDLATLVGAIPKERRREMYDRAVVGNVAAGRSLPSVTTFNAAPGAISERIDRLYRLMSALDYRRRPRDFRRVFLQIDTCLLILRNERQYQRWQELRRRRHIARAARES